MAADCVPPRTKKSNSQKHFICGIFSSCAALGYVDVTPVQYAALCVLWEQNAQTGAELGARLTIGSATALEAYYRRLAYRLGQPKAVPPAPVSSPYWFTAFCAARWSTATPVPRPTISLTARA